jgi:peptidoglycan L-alanyl-D-glutamate endopeptidase CwlK
MNQSSKDRLAKVHPVLSKRIYLLEPILLQKGIHFEVVQGLRSFAEQDALFAKGRTTPGPIVTRARGGQSNHNFGLAVDFCIVTNGQLNWNAPRALWFSVGMEGEKLGLDWGGDWTKFVDMPHLQLRGMEVDECLRLYKQGGNKLDLVWKSQNEILGIK